MITVEATIDEHGGVHLLEALVLPAARRALVTILDEPPAQRQETDSLGEAAKQARDILIQVARRDTNITYGTLVEKIQAVKFDLEDDESRYELSGLIGNISKDEHKAGRPLLSVLVVKKNDNQPGSGFFKLASKLGLASGNAGFWQEERKRVDDYWKNNSGSV